jgi:hypothetical protein
VVEPHIRFAGKPGEQWTMFFKDPSVRRGGGGGLFFCVRVGRRLAAAFGDGEPPAPEVVLVWEGVVSHALPL